ncbi:MAG: L-serine ammonia-lyase [PS1 clade bacterium]
MFISVFDLFKVGIGPSSSHTMGPMVAANSFIHNTAKFIAINPESEYKITCTLKDSLAYTGKGHATDRAVTLGINGYLPSTVVDEQMDELIDSIWNSDSVVTGKDKRCSFSPPTDIIFDTKNSLKQNPNGMVFELHNDSNEVVLSETYFSIGGGFISTLEEIDNLKAPLDEDGLLAHPFPFKNAQEMLEMSDKSNKKIWEMKEANELCHVSKDDLDNRIDKIWLAMKSCIESGLAVEGILPGGLNTVRRAKRLHQSLSEDSGHTSTSDWLFAYAMAVNEENAAGHMVVTAPTNGAAGVLPATLYFFYKHRSASNEQIRQFLLTAAAIGGLIKYNSSISGAEVGCQGEVGSAAAMAAAALCEVRGGNSKQIENAAEMSLEHHLGMTCDPVNGLVQVPCIERNGFGAIKAYTASSLALRESGDHLISLDRCVEAMRKTGLDMSTKYKETSLGGLAVSFTEC